ncbi:hypothetical protein, partial [Rhizobium laguerreae]|uniref:hypothetical protein n=1 Tax=Rhizobium laguerreae TaxID=1076926 RepID=UPI00197DBE83
MAIPISRFASVTGDIAKVQGDGKAFSSLPGQCEELERRSGGTFLMTCHCEFPPGWIRVRPIKGRTNEEAEIYGR